MSKDKFKLNSIESAIKDIRDGKIVIVVDDKKFSSDSVVNGTIEVLTYAIALLIFLENFF